MTSHIYFIWKTSFSCLKMTQKLAILAKIGHFSGIGDTKTSKYPLVVKTYTCKSTFKEPIYLCLRKIKLEAELPTMKENIDYLLSIYWQIGSKVIFLDHKFWKLKSPRTILKIFLSDPDKKNFSQTPSIRLRRHLEKIWFSYGYDIVPYFS